jgi:D-glycero-D-manno-heptose 1,7-bisphosphate phosphatase
VSTLPTKRAVFLDRDGVIVAEGHRNPTDELEPLPGVTQALTALKGAGFTLVLVTNQPDIARGRFTEARIGEQHCALAGRLAQSGAGIDAFYVCPHHPDAEIEAYRVVCDCRKPLPGLLLRATEDLGLDMAHSVMVGDRMTDIEAGYRAGCAANILVESGAYTDARIVTDAPILDIEPDVRVDNLPAAVDHILGLATSP